MSKLAVANIIFETTEANRIEYTGNNVVRVRANGGLQIPFGTTAQRASPEYGLLRYNTDTGTVEMYDAGGWFNMPTGGYVNNIYTTANAAYALANNVAPQIAPSFNTANGAFNTANAAFASANNVAPQVTPAFQTANAAFNTANAAFASANNVAPQVTPAFNTANLAFLNSNSAYTKANNALANTNGVTFGGTLTVSNNLNAAYVVTGKTAVTNNAITFPSGGSITEDSPLSMTITAPYQFAFRTSGGSYQWTFTNNGLLGLSGGGLQFSDSTTQTTAYNSVVYNTANAAYAAANNNNTYATSTFVALTAPNQTITGNLSITGALTILGNTTSISSNNLIVGDSMIYLAANNYSGTDILDIGFVANYANGTGANVHTGLIRDATTKQYYLFQGLDIELFANNTAFTPGANGVVNAVLNADLVTSNLTLGGANAIATISAAFNTANAAYASQNADYVSSNAAYGVANAAYGQSNTNTTTITSAYNTANAVYNQDNLVFSVANAAYGKANTGLQNTDFTLAGNLKIANTQTISVPIWYENESNITASYTLTAGRNAMTAGPVTLNTGVTITVPVGSTWTVV